MFAAWAIAVTATMGSLYFSEIRMFIPCELCWVQRIFMYPLAVTLAIATVKKDARQAVYTLPISVIGALFSLYHYLIQKVPALSEASDVCGIIPCNHQYINYAGFITIPFLAFTAFSMISILMIYVIMKTKE
ncbi:disulfide bond formation protein B [Alteribacter lacisalsi]|uniref:Probable disulfide formation protein n=2 Tax=Alteribacter lacisalsi TaxID=2045244 RepID=A0A2W0HPT4_9BACI|nr:disulfide bond formation protein B [Alteribacter lacisalsi]